VNEAIKLQCWSITLVVTPELCELVRHDRIVKLEHRALGTNDVAAWMLVGL